MPVGFINEMHEPPFFHGVLRPEVERQVIPTTWREGGVGIFGTLAPGLEYRAYVLNGLNAQGFSSSGIRGGRQSGNRALADDLAGAVRLDYTPFAGLTFGGSLWVGDSGQDGDFDGEKPSAFTLLWETHAQLHYRGLELRTLGTFVSIDDADVLSRGARRHHRRRHLRLLRRGRLRRAAARSPRHHALRGAVLPLRDLRHPRRRSARLRARPGNDVQLYTLGLDYKPHPQVVVKLEYRNFNAGHVRPRPTR